MEKIKKLRFWAFICSLLNVAGILMIIIGVIASAIGLYFTEPTEVHGTDSYYSGEQIIETPFFSFGFWMILTFVGVFFAILFPRLDKSFNKKAIEEIKMIGKEGEAKIIDSNDLGEWKTAYRQISFQLQVNPNEGDSFLADHVIHPVKEIHMASYQPGKFLTVKYIPETNDVAITGIKDTAEGK